MNNVDIPEVIITGGGNCSVYDAKTGSLVASYKDTCNITSKTLATIKDFYFIGAVQNHPFLKIWRISKAPKQLKEKAKFACPGIVNALTISNCNQFCLVGILEEIYINSGDLLAVLSRHYQSISTIKFTPDDSRFFSGGKDGHVMTWMFPHVVSSSIDNETKGPLFIWNHHSAEVTDIYCGNCRVATVSLDMTCKLYEVDSGILLTTICMNASLTSVVMDPIECLVFFGDDKGYLYTIDTYKELTEVIEEDETTVGRLRIHDSKIISLSVSFEGNKLLTASAKSCKLIDIQSMTCIVNIVPDCGRFSNAFLALKPGVLMTQDELFPPIFIKRFDRILRENDPGIRKYVETKLENRKSHFAENNILDETFDCKYVDKARVSSSGIMDPNAEAVFQKSFFAENVSELKSVNNQMYAYMVNMKMANMQEEK
ncbi:WD repeat-containing protein 18 [Caerostris extrusa]|uniref:WD repeat-containing protein 18 n=1 Tax=Caerostris extrusa TaxID=172846 RepID=A0AAV4Y0F9_CAEEX|nr:WD repeat-containing protein 18 [Caerostris extrusa]